MTYSVSSTKRYLKIGIIFFILLIFILFFSSLFLIFVIYTSSSPQKNQNISQHSYQYQEINLQSNDNEHHHTTNLGIVKMKRRISTEEFLSSKPSHQRPTTFISNFGDGMYRCSGSCSRVCHSKERRMSSSVLTKGVFVVLSALSTTMAVQMAKKVFEDECKDFIQEEYEKGSWKDWEMVCPDEDEEEMEFDVEKCQRENDEDETVEMDSKELLILANYLCEGHCLQKSGLRGSGYYQDYKKWTEENSECEKITRSSHISTRFQKWVFSPKQIEGNDGMGQGGQGGHSFSRGSPPLSIKQIEDAVELLARDDFIRRDLDVICEIESKIDRFNKLLGRDQYDRFCTGWEQISEGYDHDISFKYEHVKCVPEDPEMISKMVKSFGFPFEK